MYVTVIGAGYVGLTTATALAYLGHQVHCIEQNLATLKTLLAGQVPIHEPGIESLLNLDLPLSFGGWETFCPQSSVIFICVGTPAKANGEADLTQVVNAALEISQRIQDVPDLLVVIKSTVPLRTTQRIYNLIGDELAKCAVITRLTVVFNPEFLREGSSLYDTLYPDRIVIGATETAGVDRLCELYKPILFQSFTPPSWIPTPASRKLPPLVRTKPVSAELIKYAANAFLAMKISFINEISGLSEYVGADITEVAMGIGLDERIGPRFLMAGVGWGGSCFGKDIKALLHTASKYEYEMYLVAATVKSNQRQQKSIVQKLEKHLLVLQNANIGILGISFKPETDDIRDAPFLTIAPRLLELGAHVKAYDPVAISTCLAKNPSLKVTYCNSPIEVAENSDVLVILTEWQEFKYLDYKALGQKMRKKIVLDGRNMLDGDTLKKIGFTYIGVGRYAD